MMELNMGMPAGFAELIARKYDIMAQQAATQRIGVTAGARLDNVRADLMPKESVANIANTNAQTTNLGLTGRTILPMADAQIGLIGAQTKQVGAETAYTGEQTTGLKQINRVRPRSAYGLTPDLGSSLGGNLRLGW